MYESVGNYETYSESDAFKMKVSFPAKPEHKQRFWTVWLWYVGGLRISEDFKFRQILDRNLIKRQGFKDI
jgi:hypothetical protein